MRRRLRAPFSFAAKPDAIEWLVPWYAVDGDGVEGQLRREMAPGHVLESETSLTTIARRQDNDDALFQLADGRVAVVHLTWSQKRERDAAWPLTRIYPSLEEFVRTRMVEDHAEFEDE